MATAELFFICRRYTDIKLSLQFLKQKAQECVQ